MAYEKNASSLKNPASGSALKVLEKNFDTTVKKEAASAMRALASSLSQFSSKAVSSASLALQGLSDAAKKAETAISGSLAPFDEINLIKLRSVNGTAKEQGSSAAADTPVAADDNAVPMLVPEIDLSLLKGQAGSALSIIGSVVNGFAEAGLKLPGLLFPHNIFDNLRIGLERAVQILSEFFSPAVTAFTEATAEKFSTVSRGLTMMFSGAGELIGSLFGGTEANTDRALSKISAGFLMFASSASSVFSGLGDLLFGPIVNTVENVLWPAIQRAFGNILNCFSNTKVSAYMAATGIRTTFNGLLSFVSGVFSGSWEKVLNSLSGIAAGVTSTFIAVVKTPLNLFIDLVNLLISGINMIKVPEGIPVIGGIGFNIPMIPKLASGGIVSGPTLSLIGEAGDEAVLPLSGNTGWMDELGRKTGELIAPSVMAAAEAVIDSLERKDFSVELDGEKLADRLYHKQKDIVRRRGKTSVVY